MAGAYCKFCGDRCFVLRWIPNSHVSHLATCERGMALDRERTGYDHTTAFNPCDPEQRAAYERLVEERKAAKEEAA